MVAFLLIQGFLFVLLFYFVWKTFGERLFRQLTQDPELEIERKFDRVRERMAALPTREEAEMEGMPMASVEALRADLQREERELQAALENVRREKNRSWFQV